MFNPVYMNIDEFSKRTKDMPIEAVSLSIDLVCIWGINNEPMPFDDDEGMLKVINSVPRPRRIPRKKWRELRPAIDKLFVQIPDGRWVPNHEVFVVDLDTV